MLLAAAPAPTPMPAALAPDTADAGGPRASEKDELGAARGPTCELASEKDDELGAAAELSRARMDESDAPRCTSTRATTLGLLSLEEDNPARPTT
jgi:hypothetical protein